MEQQAEGLNFPNGFFMRTRSPEELDEMVKRSGFRILRLEILNDFMFFDREEGITQIDLEIFYILSIHTV